MGYGAYSYTSHQALTKSRKGKSAQSVFTQSRIHPSMNPYGVMARESRDSADNPNSLAIVFSLDISGSMGSDANLIISHYISLYLAWRVDEDGQLMIAHYT